MNKNNARTLRPIDLTVTSGTSVIITAPDQFLTDGKPFDMLFCLSKPNIVKFKDLIVGTEVVSIRDGVSGTAYVLEDKRADIFYADLLELGRCYRLVWGNNGSANTSGTTGKVGHFLCLNSPCCARRYNPANTVIPPVTIAEVN